MFKHILTAFVLLTVASYGAAITNLGYDDSAGVRLPSLHAVFGSTDNGKAAVYTDQEFSSGDPVPNGLSIYGGANYETADDYHPSSNVVVNEHVFWWLWGGAQANMRVDWWEDSGGPDSPPPGSFFTETVPAANCTFTNTGDTAFGYPIYEVRIPTADVSLTGGDDYWFGVQTQSGSNSFWAAFNRAYDSQVYFWYSSAWYPGSTIFGSEFDTYWALYASDTTDPTITDQFPTGTGVPIDVHPGCHWQDNVGINTGNSTFTVANGGAVSGTLNVDDTDPMDVIVEFIPDSDLSLNTVYTVDTYTEDLDGNSATDSWTFTTIVTGVESASLGEIKATFTK